MFFAARHFKNILTPQEAETVARVCNEFIDKNGTVLHGNLYEGGECNNFTTEKEKGDSHVGIVIGLSEIGIFESKEEPIARETTEDKKLVEMLQSRQEVIDRENLILRERNNLA